MREQPGDGQSAKRNRKEGCACRVMQQQGGSSGTLSSWGRKIGEPKESRSVLCKPFTGEHPFSRESSRTCCLMGSFQAALEGRPPAHATTWGRAMAYNYARNAGTHQANARVVLALPPAAELLQQIAIANSQQQALTLIVHANARVVLANPLVVLGKQGAGEVAAVFLRIPAQNSSVQAASRVSCMRP